MSMMVGLVIGLICCGAGLGWLLYDIKNEMQTIAERCESLEEDEE